MESLQKLGDNIIIEKKGGMHDMRENKNLEFKETIEFNTFLKTISAFANYGGGKIIFGVNDNGKVKGISDPINACLNLENKINDNMKPVPSYTLEIEKDSIIVLNVYEGLFKPYYFKNKAYKRNDSSTLEVDRLELNRLILEGQNLSFESIISSRQDLKFTILEEELISILGINSLNEDILKTLELYTPELKFNNAAALLSDTNDYKGIDIIKFGDSIDEIMDRETFENISILSLLKKATNIYKKYYQYEKIENTSRSIIELVPEKAFREAIANAIVHRLWDVNSYIKISMFADRIEITSPGGLPAGLSKEEYINGQISILRNPIIGNLFYRLRYIEKFGTGILRINNAYKDSLIKPEYKVFENSITIVLPIISKNDVLSEDEKMVIEALEGNIKISRIEIERKTKFSRDKSIRVLNMLIEKNIIAKSGSGRATKYCLLKGRQ